MLPVLKGRAKFKTSLCDAEQIGANLENSMKTTTTFLFLLSISISCMAQGPASERQQFIRAEAPVIALTHVRVIDGTGAAPLEDQTIVITGGKIQTKIPSQTENNPTGDHAHDHKG